MATLAVDPARRVELTLGVEDDLPEDERSVFVTTFLTGRQRLKVVELSKEADLKKKFSESLPLLKEALAESLVGWRSVRLPGCEEELAFDASRIDEVLTYDEIVELLTRVLMETQIAENQLKKSVLPSQSNGESSAEIADEETESNGDTPVEAESQS